MTTLIGIKTSVVDKYSVVLASDTNQTSINCNTQGNVAYKEMVQSETQKIYIDDECELALCMTGVYDPMYVDFLAKILAGATEVRKAIDRGFFEELHHLNLRRWDYKTPNPGYSNSLLLATRYDNIPKLYNCWPLGGVEEKDYTSIGSGSQYALSRIGKQGPKIPPYVSLEEGIDLAVASIDEASRDINTSGLDLVVITPDSINSYGKTIKEDMETAKAASINKIKESL